MKKYHLVLVTTTDCFSKLMLKSETPETFFRTDSVAETHLEQVRFTANSTLVSADIF
jgi:hypothetical protein